MTTSLVDKVSGTNSSSSTTTANFATTGGTTNLTATSTQNYVLTGTSGHIFILPDATTLKLGTVYEFSKTNLGGLITIKDYGLNILINTSSLYLNARFMLTDNSTAAGTWTMLFGTSSPPVAGSYAIRDLNNILTSPIFASFGTVASVGQLRLTSTDSIQWRNNANTANLSLSKNTSDVFNISTALTLGTASGTTGTLGLIGTTSGTVTIQPQAAAGTYNFNLPTTAGTSGQPLLSGGGSSTAMSWGQTQGIASTATAAGTTTLTVSSVQIQSFTGSTTQNCDMPVASTCVSGVNRWRINNYSSGNVTVRTSGGNTIITLTANQSFEVWCKDSAGGTGTASWGWTAAQTLSG